MNSTAILFWLFVLACLLSVGLIAGIISLSWVYSYPEIIAWKMQKVDFLEGYFSMNFYLPTTFRNYQLARAISAGLVVGLVVLSVISIRNRKWILKETSLLTALVNKVLKKSRAAYIDLTIAEKSLLILIFLISVCLRIFLYSYIPPHVDELTTYFQFVDKGPIFISTFYPFPNNHFFFNHIYFFSSILVDDILLAGRLPSTIFFHLLLILLFFGVLVYFKDIYAAFLSIIFCVLLFPASIYAVEARGYMLLSLLTLIAAFALLLAIETQKRQPFYIFVPACILAAYTVPVFFIPFMGIMIFGFATAFFTKNKELFLRLLISGLCVGTGVLLCYLPVFLLSGIGSVINNRFVTSLEVSDFYTRIFPIVTAEMLSFLAGIPTKGWVIFLLFGVSGVWVFLTSNTRLRLWLGLTVCIVGSLFLYALIRKSMMYERSATYNVYFLYTSFALIIFHFFDYFSRIRPYRRQVLLLLAGLLLPLTYYQYQYNRYENHLLPDPFYVKAHKVLDNAVAEKTPVYLGDETLNSYRFVYYQYRLSKVGRPSLLQDDYQNAELLMINRYKLKLNDYMLDDYVAVDSIPNIEGEPESLVLVFRKTKKSR